MITKLKSVYKGNELVRDNAVLFATTMILNLCGFLFHFYTGRVLGPKDYGVLTVLISLTYFLNVFLHSFQSNIAKYVAEYKAKGLMERVYYLFRRSVLKFFLFGLLGMFAFFIFIPTIAEFLHLEDINLLYVLGTLIVFTLLLSLVRGLMQGLQNFKLLGANLIFEGLVKFFGVVVLISLGWAIYGGILAFIFGVVLSMLIGFVPLRKYLDKSKSKWFNTNQIYLTSFPFICMVFSLTAFITIDMIMVKHFFSGVDAGLYAALSILGKILFFASISISQVMFPKVSAFVASGKDHYTLFLKSLGILLLLIVPGVIIYFLFPGMIINLIYGGDYLGLTPVLGWFALFFSFFSIVYLTSFYIIALGKYKFIALLMLFNILEVVGFIYFHDSIIQVVKMLILLIFGLAFLLLGYVFFGNLDKKFPFWNFLRKKNDN